MLAKIQPGATFKDNLQKLPSIEGVQRIDLTDGTGAVVASIENVPGKQGSVAALQSPRLVFGMLDANAATPGRAVSAAHTTDPPIRHAAHPTPPLFLALPPTVPSHRVWAFL